MNFITEKTVEQIALRWRNHSKFDIALAEKLPGEQQMVEDVLNLLQFIEDNCLSDKDLEFIRQEAFSQGHELGYVEGLKAKEE